jgi:hypothetical protein
MLVLLPMQLLLLATVGIPLWSLLPLFVAVDDDL